MNRLTSFSWSTEFVLCLVVIGDGEDKRYGRVDIKHFVFRLALNILRRAVFLRVKLLLIFYLRKISFRVTLNWHSSLDDERRKLWLWRVVMREFIKNSFLY